MIIAQEAGFHEVQEIALVGFTEPDVAHLWLRTAVSEVDLGQSEHETPEMIVPPIKRTPDKSRELGLELLGV